MDELNMPPVLADARSTGDDNSAPRARKPRRKKADRVVAKVAENMADGEVADRAAAANVAYKAAASTIKATQSVAEQQVDGVAVAAAAVDTASRPDEDVHHRIGHLTRTLHNALRELGYDKDLQATREHLPDARDRLSYIARVTGEAADKVLNAVDSARVVQEGLSERATRLRARWQAVAAYSAGAAERATPAGRTLIDETCSFFADVGGQADATNSILTDIMMAQDFHDLTGQVIRKVVTLASNLEEQLLRLLIETTPPEQRKKVDVEKLEGPIVKAEGRDDVVTDQAAVDDLLATLGF